MKMSENHENVFICCNHQSGFIVIRIGTTNCPLNEYGRRMNDMARFDERIGKFHKYSFKIFLHKTFLPPKVHITRMWFGYIHKGLCDQKND